MMVNASIYTIHGWYGIKLPIFLDVFKCLRYLKVNFYGLGSHGIHHHFFLPPFGKKCLELFFSRHGTCKSKLVVFIRASSISGRYSEKVENIVISQNIYASKFAACFPIQKISSFWVFCLVWLKILFMAYTFAYDWGVLFPVRIS